MTDEAKSGDSRRAVLASLAGNGAIALIKGGVALITGSGGMLAETAHSIADTVDQGLLFVGVEVSNDEATTRHPLGFGMQRYFWALIVALLIFFGGGMFSLFEAYQRLASPEEVSNTGWAFGVLAASAVFEGWSLSEAIRALRAEARRNGRRLWPEFNALSDPVLRTVLFENGSDLVGLALAALGLALAVTTGDTRWDTAGTAAIGVLLVGVAVTLANDVRHLITGEAPPQHVRSRIHHAIREDPSVASIADLDIVRAGAGRLLVLTRVRAREGASATALRELPAKLHDEIDGSCHETVTSYVEIV